MNEPSDDTFLLSLVGEYLEKNAHLLSLSAECEFNDDRIIRMTASILGLRELRDQIAILTPAAIEGWRAKFRVAIALLGDERDDPDDDITFIRASLREFIWEPRT